MKFLFVQKSGLPWHGVMSLSAVLKQAGVNTDLVLTDEERLMPYIRKYEPDFVGFHTISGEHPWVIGMCQEIHEQFPKVKTVVGGPHATYCPEDLEEHVDYVVRGEADESILELSKLLPGTVPLFPLVQELSSLPIPDRTIYYKYPHLAKSTVKQFLTGRGCAYSCSFCLNHVARRLYNGQKWVRRRTVEDVMAELVRTKREYGFKTISFSDDVFGLDRKWLEQFLPLYKSEIKSPFMCNIRCDMVDDDLITLLKSGGCYGVEMGIESGSERIRKNILGKGKATNKVIEKAGHIVKKHGLVLKTFNMIGIPTETLEECFDTVRLNASVHPDHASCTFLIPYPKYDVAKHFPESEELSLDNLAEGSYLRPMKWVDSKVVNLQSFFFIAVKLPKLIGIVKLLIRLPPNPVYRVLAQLFYGLFMARCHRLTVGDMIRYGMHTKPNRL